MIYTVNFLSISGQMKVLCFLKMINFTLFHSRRGTLRVPSWRWIHGTRWHWTRKRFSRTIYGNTVWEDRFLSRLFLKALRRWVLLGTSKLEVLSDHFSTLELNSTTYSPVLSVADFKNFKTIFSFDLTVKRLF